MFEGWAAVALTEGGRWRPGIGDPTVLGWVTVAAYLVAAVGCAMAAPRESMLHADDRRGRPGSSRFWMVLAGLLVALGINKQLDLQSLVTQIGRDLVGRWGLYSGRRELQIGFIAAVAMACALGLSGFLWAARRRMRTRWPAVAGMIFILGFVMIRAASFHHVDALLAARLGGLKWNWILELGGIGVVASAAFRVALSQPPGRDRLVGGVVYRYKINSR